MTYSSKLISPALLLGPTALLLCFFHWLNTPADAYMHDSDGIFPYIQFVAEKLALPLPWNCGECMQAPLYFIFAGVVYKFAQLIGQPPFEAVSLLSLVFYGLYMYFSGKLIRENTSSYGLCLVATAVVFFWPLGFHMGRIINNDVPLIMAQVAGFYYALRWWKTPHSRDLIRAMFWTALAMNFKFTALISVAMLAGIVLAKLGAFGLLRMLNMRRDILLLLLLAGVIAMAPIARVIYLYMSQPVPQTPVIFIYIDRDYQRLTNALYHFTLFDFNSYFKVPFYHIADDAGGRQYFWNSLLKTSLFDEFPWRGDSVALYLGILELGMVFYMLVANAIAIYQKNDDNRKLLLLVAAFNIVALIIYRTQSTVACTQEYRYVYFITPIFALLYARAIEHYQQRGDRLMGMVGQGMGLLFALCSIAFILINDLKL